MTEAGLVADPSQAPPGASQEVSTLCRRVRTWVDPRAAEGGCASTPRHSVQHVLVRQCTVRSVSALYAPVRLHTNT
jgi:hypothetical protein